jgi:hypothetical protein
MPTINQPRNHSVCSVCTTYECVYVYVSVNVYVSVHVYVYVYVHEHMCLYARMSV